MRIRSTALAGLLVPLTGIIVTACGSSSSASHAKPVAAAASTVNNPKPPAAHLHILSPRPGAHTGQTVIVRLRLAGGGSPGRRAFVYRLDRHRPKRAGALFTLRHLHPGHHRLVISFDNGAKVTAATAFTVKAPKPQPAAAPATTAASPPTPTTSTAAAPPATTPTTAPPPPASSTTTTSPPPPPPASGIPQNNGGDGDADNNGGPTDGDGNI
jgi:hypothetical protein